MPEYDVKFTLKELKRLEPALNAFLGSRIDSQVTFRVRRYAKQLKDQLDLMEEIRQELIAKYGARMSNGEMTVKPDNIEQYFADYGKMMNETVTLRVRSVTEEEMAKAGLSVGHVALLDFMIEGGSTPQ